MPSKKQYNLVPNDEGDTRIPLHSDEAFHHGITFQAKYIGSMDVPRPSSRVEIVAAMRRIRYEFKAKGVKKKKVLLEVSVDGVRVSLRKKKKKKQWMDDSGLLLMHHPVYRIFYVSHDSQDLKIFSYIARDGASNVFRCNVFKSNKKNQAMRVVRTVGQAFEVCHKLSIGPGSPARDDHSERDSEGASDKTTRKGALSTQLSVDGLEDSVQDSGSYDDSPRSPPPRGLRLDLQRPRSPQVNRKDMNGSPLPDEVDRDGDRDRGERDRDREPSAGSLGGGSLLHHEVQLLREQLEQQVQQTQAAMAQVNLLRDQLAAEKAARMEAQARTHQLLGHNRELLDHITALVAHLQEQEGGAGGSQPLQLAPQCDQLGPALYPPDFQDAAQAAQAAYAANMALFNMGVPGSPVQTLRGAGCPGGTLFGFPYQTADQQFQAQLLQRLQSLSGYAPAAATARSPTPFGYPQSPTLGYRMSQPSPFGSSPAMAAPPSHQSRAHSTPAGPATPSPSAHSAGSGSATAGAGGSASTPQDEESSFFIRPLSQVGTLTTTDNDGRTRVIVPVPMDDDNRLSAPPAGRDPPSPGGRSPRYGGAAPASASGGSGGNTKRQQQQLAAAMATLDAPHGPQGGSQGAPQGGVGGGMRRLAPGGPPFITRSTSEKVPNRSELMTQVTRAAWARHTTK